MIYITHDKNSFVVEQLLEARMNNKRHGDSDSGIVEPVGERDNTFQSMLEECIRSF